MSEMKKTIIRKLNTSSGFTLAEALVAVLILLMVSSIVATGIPAAKNAYEKVVLASNAEVLMSTTISTLRNELGTASSVDITGGGKSITYFNPSINAASMISLNSELPEDQRLDDPLDVIVYQRYAGATIGTTEATSAVTRLVSEQASTQGLYATYTSVTKDNDKGTITFHGLSVNQAGPDGTAVKQKITSRNTLSIRVITY